MRPTLVTIGTRQIGDHQLNHGDEVPPGSLPPEVTDRMIDQKQLAEHPARRSLYKIFAPFSGATEREPLDAELTPFALPN